MAVDRKQQMKEITERLEQGVKDGKIPQLQLQQYAVDRYAAA